MAIRQEELQAPEAVVYRFPTQAIKARRARARMIHRRQRTLGIAAVLAALTMLVASGPPDHALEGPDRPGMHLKLPR